MSKKPSTDMVVTADEIQNMVRVVRGQRVMLDFDLARLYGVPTSALNQAVQRNADRFPRDFAYQVTQQEVASLMSQIVISKPGRGGRRKLPWAFTEHGVAMLSSVLRSPTAVRVNIEIMRTFVRLRRLMATPGELVEQLTRLAETVQLPSWRSWINTLERAGSSPTATKANRVPPRSRFYTLPNAAT